MFSYTYFKGPTYIPYGTDTWSLWEAAVTLLRAGDLGLRV